MLQKNWRIDEEENNVNICDIHRYDIGLLDFLHRQVTSSTQDENL